MNILDQVTNILSNHNLTNTKTIKALLSRDLSSYENYSSGELLEAILADYKLELESIQRADFEDWYVSMAVSRLHGVEQLN
jgi:hypothetical protein